MGGSIGRIVGGVVGAIIGSIIPGAGTALGWAIGSSLGGAYDTSRMVLQGPKIGDVAGQTSNEGGFRPIVYGRSHPIQGNVIADGGPNTVTTRRRQGKGGRTHLVGPAMAAAAAVAGRFVDVRELLQGDAA